MGSDKLQENKNQDSLNKFLFDESEEIISVLGNNTAQTFISTGVLGNGFAVLSNKRVYFKGNCLIRKGKGVYTKSEEKAVDIGDITGTGFVHNKALWARVLYIVFFSFTIAFLIEMLVLGLSFGIYAFLGGLFWVVICGGLHILFKFLYKSYNYSAFEITYAGGGIAFDMHWITDEESKEFQRSLNLLKDKIKEEKSEKKESFQSYPKGEDIPDQLMKFKNLLEQGVITQEEFEKKKKQLLNL